ncbi:MAG: sensor histidine kinase [Wujia sp.]
MPDLASFYNSKRSDSLSRLSVLLSIAAGIVMTGFLLWLGVTDNIEVYQSREDRGFEVMEEVACRELEDTATPIGIKKEYVFSLDRRSYHDVSLAFYTVHQNVEVFLDGECVFRMEPAKERSNIKTAGSNWVMIPLYKEDAGKEIRVVITPVYASFRDRQVEFLLGSPLAIYRYRLAKDLPQIILGIMAVFVGIVFLCVATYNVIEKGRGKSLISLGLFSTMMGLWRLTDTRFTPFILPEKPVFLFYVSICMLMLGMVPLMKWLEEYFEKAGRQVLDVCCIVDVSACLIQVLLQVCGILDFREMLALTHILIGIDVVVAIGIAVYERKMYPQKIKIPAAGRLSYLFVAGVLADVAAFYIKGNSSGLLFSLMAFLFYILFLGIATMYNYSEQEVWIAEQQRQIANQEKELAETKQKLTERRIAVMMSQIRTHFIFNVLTTISGFCKYDAKKADEALIRFARYLRKNIKTIEEEGMIDFSAELEQLEDYVALEQMRFPDRILFCKDIEEMNFKLPPLTVQPLVENAIKHGLLEHDRSGMVMLRTQREEEMAVITITDDGAGFLPQEIKSKESVGIRNVRYRLENMAGGSLTIDSTPGEGTKVTIKIPMEAAE